jgi:hypothetical protein
MILRTLGAPEMTGDHDGCSPFREPLECRQKGPDSPVISDSAVVQWNVGIDTQENHATV